MSTAGSSQAGLHDGRFSKLYLSLLVPLLALLAIARLPPARPR